MRTVSIAAKELFIKNQFYGFFLMSLDKSFSKRLPTAGVSLKGIGYKLEINEEYWKSLSSNHKLGLLQHELLHLAFYHFFMRENFNDYKLFNIAADLEVNQHISDEWLHPNWVLIDNYPNLNLKRKAGTKYYYEKLRDNLNSDNPDPNLVATYAGAGEMHITWDDIEKSLEGDPEKDVKLDVLKTQLERQLKDTAEGVGRGLIPGELFEMIEELFKIKPQIFNWKAYFRRYLGHSFNIYTKKSYKKPSSRFDGSPGLKIRKKHHILVIIDTSMSVSTEDFEDFFSEIDHIHKSGCSIDIVECDTRVYPPYKYTGKMPTKINGRGGTYFSPGVEYYNKNKSKYTTMIYFTDGYGERDIVKPIGKTMWVITRGGRMDKDYYPGYSIFIPEQK